MILEDLEGRRLLSLATESIVSLRDYTASTMISGPDGDLWIAVAPTLDTAAIDRIGLNGSVTTFPMPANAPVGGLQIVSLTNGPDGDVWFAADCYPPSGGNQVVIGNITPAGVVTEFPPIPVPAGEVASSYGIVSGPGGDLWFDYTVFSSPRCQNYIGRVTTAGAVTLFPTSSFSATGSTLDSIAAGADGNIWFTAGAGKAFVFGRMSPTGVVTRIPIAELNSATVANGPNGSLILTGQTTKNQNEVFDVSTAGVTTRYKVPASISSAFGSYLGSADGSLWFTDRLPGAINKIGRINASGVASSYNLFAGGREHDAGSMAIGQDSNLYVLESILATPADIATAVYLFAPTKLPPARGAG